MSASLPGLGFIHGLVLCQALVKHQIKVSSLTCSALCLPRGPHYHHHAQRKGEGFVYSWLYLITGLRCEDNKQVFKWSSFMFQLQLRRTEDSGEKALMRVKPPQSNHQCRTSQWDKVIQRVTFLLACRGKSHDSLPGKETNSFGLASGSASDLNIYKSNMGAARCDDLLLVREQLKQHYHTQPR